MLFLGFLGVQMIGAFDQTLGMVKIGKVVTFSNSDLPLVATMFLTILFMLPFIFLSYFCEKLVLISVTIYQI